MNNASDKPVIFNNKEQFDGLLAEQPHLQTVDAFSRQLIELFKIENIPARAQSDDEIAASSEFQPFAKQFNDKAVYVRYPWNGHVVRCVSEEHFIKLKTNRNQDLITAAEQKKLYRYRVAVLGMSVGSNIAFTLTQAGISKQIVIADFDELDTTNMNRIFAGAHEIGLNKTLIAARRIYEDNPFAEVTRLDKGIDAASLERLLKDGAIDCIIEEIDNVAVKIDARRLARQYKKPVIMITDNGDGVVLHVERYDLGYAKIFNRDDGYWERRLANGLTKEIAGDIIINDCVGGPQLVDPKMMASVKRVLSGELVSWSQLGSASLLGGVAATVALKRIVNQESAKLDIREHINMPNF